MISSTARVFVATEPVSFRGGFDHLAGIVREKLADDPRSGALFVFFNRDFNRLKVCFFDRTGDCVLYKRLDRRTFRGIIEHDSSRARVEIDAAALRRLLAGVERPKNQRVH